MNCVEERPLRRPRPRSRARGSAAARWLPCLLLALGASASALAGTIAGRVLNGATGQYLKNAEVRLAGTDRVALTAEDGSFGFADVPAGTAALTVTYPGLARLEKSYAVPETGAVGGELALSETGDADVVQMAEFRVGAQREGNAQAIVEQKMAINVVNVIAADAFGDVTEGNVGEFLKLLPGVAVDYVDADVRTVRVRGLSPKYANVTLDGHPIANAASSSIATGRQFEFEQVSLATLETIEVNKSPTADMPASGLTGVVNVRSKSAFSQKGRRIKYNLNVNVNEYAAALGETAGWDDGRHAKWQPGGTFEFSDTFLDGRLGVVVGLSHSGSYVEQKILIPTYTFDRNATNNATEFPIITTINLQDGLKPTWRDSFVVNLDYRAGDDLKFALRTSYNRYDAPFHNRNWQLNANTTGLAFNTDGTTNAASLANLTNRTAVSATSVAPNATNTASSATVLGSNFRKYGATFLINPALQWRRGDLTFDGSFQYSQARNWYDSAAEGFFSLVSARMNGVTWAYEFADETAVRVQQVASATSNPGSLLSLANYNSAVTVNAEERNGKDQVWSGRGDFTFARDQWRRPTTFKFGGDWRLQVRDIQNFLPSWSVNANPAAGGINLGDYADPYQPSFRKGETITDRFGVTGPAPSADKWRLYELFTKYDTNPFAISYATAQPFTANAAANLRNKLQSMWDVQEKIWSAYAMATVDVTRSTQLLAGVRYESTRTEGKAFDDIGHQAAAALAGTTNTNDLHYIWVRYRNRVTKTKAYDSFFPSVQFRWEPRRDLVLRGAYFASILRPDFSNVAGGISVSDAEPYTFTVSNADLVPETAHNYDLRLEYYFEPVGVVSVGVFRKEIKDIQLLTSGLIDLADIPDAIANLGFTSAMLNNATVSQSVNGGDSSIWGVEVDYSQQLSFLPGAWRGLGVFANFTYNKPKDTRLFSLTAEDGIPPRTANAGVSYRKGRFNGQVKFNWSDERMRAITGVRVNAAGEITPVTTANGAHRIQYTAARSQLDVNLNWELTRRTTLFLNVSNLFDSPQVQFVENRDWLQRHGEYGTRYTAGVKGSF